MPKFNEDAIAAVFSTVARLVREEKPVVLRNIEGLNAYNARFFKAAVTHSFNEKDHGVDLQRIFIVDKDNPHLWHRNTSPNKNPGDFELIQRIMAAMSYVSKETRGKKTEVVVEKTLSDFTLDELKAEVQRRERLIEKEHYSQLLGCSVEELSSVVEKIVSLL